MHLIRKGGFSFTKVDRLAIITFISSLSLALVGTVWAVYLESYLHNASYVGFVSTFFIIIATITCISATHLIERSSKTKIFLISLALYGLSYLMFSFVSNIYIIIILGALVAIVSSLKIIAFGIILRDNSKDKSVSKNVSLVFTFLNLAWVIGPLIAGFIAQKYGITRVFLLASVILLASTFLFKSFGVKDEKKIKDNTPMIKNLIEFLKNKDRLIVYILTGGVSFWWVLIYTYIPIYIIESGLNDEILGYFLFSIVTPLILLEYYFGRVVAKKGFRKMFFTGFLIISILALSCFFVENIYIILLLLVLASVGMAMVEPTTESYFFDITNERDRNRFYGPYNTSLDVFTGIALFVSAGILLIFPFKSIFLFFGLMMVFFAFLSLKIRNVVECRRK